MVSKLKSVTGNGSDEQMAYIGRTMAAIDADTDWSWLNIDFKGSKLSGEMRGRYDPYKAVITIGENGGKHTVAHEMGHALDSKWA